jgi:hypothetical protein
VVERAQRRSPFRPRQLGYPLSVDRQVCGLQSPLACVRSTVLAPPFPPPGPGEPGSPSSSVVRRRYDFLPAQSCSLMVSVAGSTGSSCVRVRRSAPDKPGGRLLGPEHSFNRRSLPGKLRPWAQAGPHRFPGAPSHTSALFQDPGQPTRPRLLVVSPTPPPVHPHRRPQLGTFIEANTGLQHPLSTLHERRRRLPCKTRFQLAGCASTERGRTLWIASKGFRLHPILLCRDFSCRNDSLCQPGRVRVLGGMWRVWIAAPSPDLVATQPELRRLGSPAMKSKASPRPSGH